MKKSKSIIKVLMVLTLVAMLTMLTGCGNKDEKEKEEAKNSASYTVAIDNYFKGMEKADADTYKSAYPDFYVDEYMDIVDDEYLEDHLESFEDKYGENIKISYEVSKEEDIEKDDLKTIEQYIKEIYNESVKVEEGKKVKLKATIKGKDDDETDTTTMYVYKIDGEWKMFDVSPEHAYGYVDDEDEDEDEDDSKNSSKNNSSSDKKNSTNGNSSSTVSTNADYKSVLDNYYKGIEKADTTTLFKAYPKFYQETLTSVYNEEELKKAIEMLEDLVGSNVKITYKVTSEKKYTSDELAKIKEYIKQYANQESTVSEGYELEVEATITGDDDSETDDQTVYVYKIDGTWSMLHKSPADVK